MTTDPLTFAREALGCRPWGHALLGCISHKSADQPCPEATRLATLIEERDRAIRADECEQAAAMVRARVTADNADIGPNGRALERHRAARHRGDTNG